VAGRPIVSRASIGIALSQPGDSGRQILHRADQAMYYAKREAIGWSLAPADRPMDAVSVGTPAAKSAASMTAGMHL
jgi:GGDEF domain-containing protein